MRGATATATAGTRFLVLNECVAGSEFYGGLMGTICSKLLELIVTARMEFVAAFLLWFALSDSTVAVAKRGSNFSQKL